MIFFGVECQNWQNCHGSNCLWCKFASSTPILGSFRQLLQKLHEDWPSRLQFWTFAALEKCEFRSKCQKPVQSYKRRLREHSKVVFQQFQNVQNFAFKEASLRTFPSICQFFPGSSAPQPRPLLGCLNSILVVLIVFGVFHGAKHSSQSAIWHESVMWFVRGNTPCESQREALELSRTESKSKI